MIKAVIFDMDGTILNTLDDLRDAVNYALGVKGLRNDYDIDTVRMFFGSGIKVAFERALALEKGCPFKELEFIGTNNANSCYAANKNDTALIDELIKIYLPYYNEHCNDKTDAYPGIISLLKELKNRNIKIAVVSNKPDSAVKILCEQTFNGLFDFSLGELPDIKRKPSREMIDKSLKALNVNANEAFYVGDSEIDLLTAINSDMMCIAVTWGFRGRDFLQNHNAENIIDNPKEVLKYL